MKESFIARQPILTVNNEIFGYELLFRSSATTNKASFQDAMEATTALLSNMLTNFGPEWLLGGSAAFINISESALFSDFIELLNPNLTFFEITPQTIILPKVIDQIQTLRQKGYRFILDDCAHFSDKKALYPHIDYIKIDCQRTGMLGLLNEITEYQNHPTLKNIQFIATKVESESERQQCINFGCTLLQGYFFEKPQLLLSKNLSPNAAALLKILYLTRKESSLSEIEDALKKDVSSSLKLLRYINSAGFGFRNEIHSFKQAVQLLGYQKLTKWVLLLLATSNTATPPALAKAAIFRGRFLEIIGQQQKLSQEDIDNLFITGTFSFLDALLGVQMDLVLPTLGLHENVNQALLQAQGIFYPYLLLSIACERSLYEDQKKQSSYLNLTPEQVNRALLEATQWSEQFVKLKN